jgi:hypothetical protein
MFDHFFGKKELIKLTKTRIRVILLAILGILTLSITMTPALGWWRTFNLRHIDDWMANNPFGSSPGWGGYDNDDNFYFVYLVDDYQWYWHDFTYTGCVVEEVRPDGSLKFTVILQASNVYIEVYNSLPDWAGREDLVGIGTMDFVWIHTFILEPSYPGGDTWWGYIEPGVRGPGCEIPFMFIYIFFPDEIGGQDLTGDFEGYGSIDLMEPGSYWDPPNGVLVPPPVPTGETADVYVHQEYYYDYYGNEVWPQEWIIIS